MKVLNMHDDKVKIITEALKNLYNYNIDPSIIKFERPRNPEFGDWTSTFAVRICKDIGKRPEEIAKEVAGEVTRILENSRKINDLIKLRKLS